jgi:hypothetical protein
MTDWVWALVGLAVAALIVAVVAWRWSWLVDHVASLSQKIRSPGYQALVAKLARYQRLCATVAPGARAEITKTLDAVHEAIDNRVVGIIVPKYDEAWSRLHEARGQLCQHAAAAELLGVLVADIRADEGFLVKPKEQLEFGQEVDRLRKELLKRAPDPRIREGLLAVSERGRLARDDMWLKADMKRTRITIMGFLLGASVVIAIGTLPTVLSGPSWLFFLTLAAFGALGGVISSLYAPEPVTGKAMDFYINRRLLYLRPIIGTALAIASYVAIQGHAFTLFNIGPNSPTAGFMFVGAAAGFSERAFVTRLFNAPSKDSSASQPNGNG